MLQCDRESSSGGAQEHDRAPRRKSSPNSSIISTQVEQISQTSFSGTFLHPRLLVHLSLGHQAIRWSFLSFSYSVFVFFQCPGLPPPAMWFRTSNSCFFCSHIGYCDSNLFFLRGKGASEDLKRILNSTTTNPTINNSDAMLLMSLH